MQQQRTTDSWRRVRASAFSLVERHGFQQVSISDIAKEAGISRRTFFNYFPDKESVLFDPDPDHRVLCEVLLTERSTDAALWPTLGDLVIEYSDGTMALISRQVGLLATSLELRSCSRQVTDRFWDAVGEWAVARYGDTMRTHVLLGAARAATSTALQRWDRSTGAGGLHAMLREAFAVLEAPQEVTA